MNLVVSFANYLGELFAGKTSVCKLRFVELCRIKIGVVKFLVQVNNVRVARNQCRVQALLLVYRTNFRTVCRYS